MRRLAPRGGIDFYSGLLLIAVAAGASWLVSDLDLGSARDMGPAYFPLMVSTLLGAIGLIMLLRGLLMPGTDVQHFELRPLFFVLASFVAFGLLIRPAGLVIAIVAQVGIGHFATSEARPLESLLFAIGMAAFSSILFVYLLRIPVSVLPW
jgi:putative tricarboxylic transport membrane protein